MRNPPHKQTAKGAGIYFCPSPGLDARNSWAQLRSGLWCKRLHWCCAPLLIPSCFLCSSPLYRQAGSEPCTVITDKLLGGQKSKQLSGSPRLLAKGGGSAYNQRVLTSNQSSELHKPLVRALKGSKPARISLRYPLEWDGYHAVYFCRVFWVSSFSWSTQGS